MLGGREEAQGRSRLEEERALGLAAGYETGKHLAAGVCPLEELVGRTLVIALVEELEESRALELRSSNIKCKADE